MKFNGEPAFLEHRRHAFEKVSHRGACFGRTQAEAYNLTNRLNRANPDLVITSSTFGQALRQTITTGRQVELGMKIIF